MLVTAEFYETPMSLKIVLGNGIRVLEVCQNKMTCSGIHRRVKEMNSGNASELQVIFWKYIRIQTHPIIHRGNSGNTSEYKTNIFENTSDR